MSLISTTIDPQFEHLPDATLWDKKFLELNKKRHLGFYYGSPLPVGPIGLHAIFEGQARFIQLQYLSSTVNGRLTFESLKDQGYLEGIYGEAFEVFCKLTKTPPPVSVDDPIVALFLLICDQSINPSVGFPLNIESFENFIIDVDAGVRFGRLCKVVADYHPELLQTIVHYSRDDYVHVSKILADTCGYHPPMIGLKEVVAWCVSVTGLATIMKEKETFLYNAENLPARVLLSHFVSFCEDELARA